MVRYFASKKFRLIEITYAPKNVGNYTRQSIYDFLFDYRCVNSNDFKISFCLQSYIACDFTLKYSQCMVKINMHVLYVPLHCAFDWKVRNWSSSLFSPKADFGDFHIYTIVCENEIPIVTAPR